MDLCQADMTEFQTRNSAWANNIRHVRLIHPDALFLSPKFADQFLQYFLLCCLILSHRS